MTWVHFLFDKTNNINYNIDITSYYNCQKEIPQGDSVHGKRSSVTGVFYFSKQIKWDIINEGIKSDYFTLLRNGLTFLPFHKQGIYSNNHF